MDYKKLTISLLVLLLFSGAAGVFIKTLPVSGAQSRTVQDVSSWQQVNSNGFGDPLASEVSALEAFNGYLYAGIHSDANDARIYRSSDGLNWDPVIEPGFGISHDIAPRAILDFIVFNNRLYTSTGRGGDPGQIYRTLNGTSWAPMVIYGFNDQDNVDISAFAVYGGMIYAGVTNSVSGAQIWRSYTGDNNSWTQVAPDTPGTAAATITGFAEFDGALYAAVESESPAQIWQSFGGAANNWTTIVSDGFGSSSTTMTGGMVVFGGYLYVGAGNTSAGAQLWRTNNGTDWAQAITPGFGDSNNQKVESVYVFQNTLYISVKNTVTGVEIWRSTNGSVWEQANLDGFGDSHNSDSNWSNATANFLGQLYAGTANAAAGGELWRMQANGADLGLSMVDTVDPVTLGDPIEYTLTVSNAGPDLAQSVVLTDTLPVGVSYISAVPDQGTCGELAGTVTCSLGDIASSGQRVVQLVVMTQTTGLLTNQANVASNTVDPDGSNNTSSETTIVNSPSADLGLNIVDAVDPVTLGDPIEYTLTVSNAGPDLAQSVVLTDTLPAGVSYISAVPDQGTCAEMAGTVTCSLGDIANSGQRIVQLAVMTQTTGLLTNLANVASNTVDPDGSNNTSNEATIVNPPGLIYIKTFLPLELYLAGQ